MEHNEKINQIREDLDDVFTRFDLDDKIDSKQLLSTIEALDGLISDVKTMMSIATSKAETFMDGPFESNDLPGVEIVGAYGTTRKSWDSESLKPLVAEAILEEAVNPETGTIDMPLSVLVLKALEYVSFSNWKITPLKGAGLNPDHYCEKSPGNYKVTVKRNGKRYGN